MVEYAYESVASGNLALLVVGVGDYLPGTNVGTNVPMAVDYLPRPPAGLLKSFSLKYCFSILPAGVSNGPPFQWQRFR